MDAPSGARIGPNAIIRVVEAVTEQCGRAAALDLLEAAALDQYRAALPEAMVDEDEVTRLQAALRARFPTAQARALARDAGLRTGDYLLAVRIPRPAQRLLTLLPAPLAARALVRAMRANAWTFAGSGRFDALPGKPLRLRMIDSPLCRGATASEPACDFFAGTFERLFSRLVHPNVQVEEIACAAIGDPACLFEIRW